MSKKYTFSVVGGDHRQVVIIRMLLSRGHCVKVFSLASPTSAIEGAEICSSLEKALTDSDVILLPLPMSRDRTNLNLTAQDCNVGIHDLIKICSRNDACIIFGGLIGNEAKAYAEDAKATLIDYYNFEDLQQRNALPSAEGAIMVAMENTDRVIEGMRVLICGYGRIGKLLADKMKRLGASVSVAARRDEILCEIAMAGFEAVDLRQINDLIRASQGCEVIFNTIPSQIFTRQVVEKIVGDPLYIEIASAPGGIDLQSARERKMRIIFAPSLPGRYAPASAGEYIFETIKDILSKRGMDI